MQKECKKRETARGPAKTGTGGSYNSYCCYQGSDMSVKTGGLRFIYSGVTFTTVVQRLLVAKQLCGGVWEGGELDCSALSCLACSWINTHYQNQIF